MKKFLKILFLMYFITAVLLFLLAFLVQKCGWQEKGIQAGVCIVCVISCFLGGFCAGKIQKTRKFLWGLLAGCIYAAMMFAVTFFVQKGIDGGADGFLWNALLCLGAGMIGGMIAP